MESEWSTDAPEGHAAADDAEPAPVPLFVVCMGVMGAGKSTLARAVAQRLAQRGHRACMVEADHHHPPASRAKLAAGQALTDEDRQPWLQALVRVVRSALASGRTVVLACSALKHAYRVTLARAVDQPVAQLLWVHLEASAAAVAQRLRDAPRRGHLVAAAAEAALLASQYDTLEAPHVGTSAALGHVMRVAATAVPLAHNVERVCSALQSLRAPGDARETFTRTDEMIEE